MATKSSSPYRSAKGVKAKPRQRFGPAEKWPEWEKIVHELEKAGTDGILVPLKLWKDRRKTQNEKRTKPLPEANYKNFKANLTTHLAQARRERDFTIELAEDDEHLIIRVKG